MSFDTSQRLKNHTRKHRTSCSMVVDKPGVGSVSLTFNRVDGHYATPCGEHKFEHDQALRRHVRRCLTCLSVEGGHRVNVIEMNDFGVGFEDGLSDFELTEEHVGTEPIVAVVDTVIAGEEVDLEVDAEVDVDTGMEETSDGWGCVECNFSTVKYGSMRSHLSRSKHGGHVRCTVRIVGSRKYTRVSAEDIVGRQAANIPEDVLVSFLGMDADVSAQYSDPHNIDFFYKKYGKVDVSAILSQVRLQYDANLLTRVKEVLVSLLGEVDAAEYGTKRLFKKFPLSTLQTNTKPKYLAIWRKLVCFILSRHPNPQYIVSPQQPMSVSRLMVFELLTTVFFQTKLENDNKLFVEEFLEYMFLKRGRVLRTSGEVHDVCSKVLYLLNMTAVLLVISAESGSARKTMVKKVSELFRSSSMSALVTTKDCGNLAKSIHRNTFALPKIIKDPDCPHTFRVWGVRISVDALGVALRGIRSECARLQDQLCFGASFDINTEALSAIMSDREPGIGIHFLDDANKMRYSKMLLGTCYGRNQSGMIGNRELTSTYVKVHGSFVRAMCALIHLSSGGMARGTELCSYTLLNNGSLQRSVFFDGRRVFFVASHNKTNTNTGSMNRIARFLTPEDSLMVLREILIVRPFVRFLLKKAEQEETQKLYTNYLFVSDCRRMNSQAVSRAFSSHLAISGSVVITFARFRHFATTLVGEYHLGVKEDAELNNTPQFGHSLETSRRIYGMTNLDGPIKYMLLDRHRQASVKWHSFLLDPSVLELGEASAAMEEPQILAAVPAAVTTPSSLQLDRVVRTASNVAAVSTVDIIVGNNDQFLRTIDACKSLYGPTFAFRSLMQQVAVEASLFGSEDLIVVLPTGMGKSICFFAYAKINPGKCVLVVVPTVTLRDDLIRRAAGLGIPAHGVIERMGEVYGLAILTPEAVMSSTAMATLCNLGGTRRLGRIFIDECHFIFEACRYRTDFSALFSMRVFGPPSRTCRPP